MKKQQRWNVNTISMPKGGGAFQGLGEESAVQDFTGEFLFRLPLFVSPCRSAEPELVLEYHSTAGNGVFGFGFSLDIPSVIRQTSKRIPRYNDLEDTFILSGNGELVAAGPGESMEGKKRNIYIQRYEKDFNRIEYIEEDGGSYWKTTGRDNTVSLFGKTEESRIADPEDRQRIFSWLLCETVDEKGNKIRYRYNEEQQIQQIQYGNYFAENGKEKFIVLYYLIRNLLSYPVIWRECRGLV